MLRQGLVMHQNDLKEYMHYIRDNIQEKLSSKSNGSDPSKENLYGYLALNEIVDPMINSILIAEGFIPLNKCCPHIMYTINKIVEHLERKSEKNNFITVQESKVRKEKRTVELFGRNRNSTPHIMVTLDRSMLENPKIFEELILGGMTIARINCAHDNLETWKSLIRSLRTTEAKLNSNNGNTVSTCKIYIDLPGPKIRIGEFKTIDDEIVVIKVKAGDRLRIYRNSTYQGTPGCQGEPASIGITIPKALQNVRVGDRIYIDDGKIFANVTTVYKEYIDSEIVLTRKKVEKLKQNKGINFPDSLVHLSVPTISETDLTILEDMHKEIDIVGISFIHQPNDIKIVKEKLKQLSSGKVGIVAKIETKQALFTLSQLLLEGLNHHPFGVMIARGDLAVEIGMDQLASAQEGIMELCDAAHTPVIWATGVLDRMNKKNIPSISELTDAYFGLRADCIMFNKGPYVPSTLGFIQQLNQINKDYMFQSRESLLPFVQYGF
jgi:pyruvate kinase